MDEHLHSASFRDVALIALRQRRLIAGVYVAIVVTALVAIFVLPPQYRAASKVLLTTNRAQISTSAERPTELIRNSQVGDAELNSQVEILRSRDLVEGVLRDLGVRDEPADNPNALVRAVRAILASPVTLVEFAYRHAHGLDAEATTPLYWKVKSILAAIDVSILKSSNVIEIALAGPDPAWAREFIDRLTTAYVDRHAQLQQETEAEGFFTKQSEILRQKLTDSEGALRSLREKAGALAGQQAEVHERLNEFNADLARTKIARAEQEERVAFLERTRGTDGHGGRVATPELLALEAKRAELLGRYRPKSERVRDIDEQIARLRTAVASYDPATAGRDAASVDLTATRAALFALKGKEEALAQQRDEYQKKAELLDAQNFDLVRLERQVKLDEEAYLSYVRTAEQSRLSNALEQSKMLRLTVVEPASVPLEPVSPKKGRIMLLALLGGMVVSLGAGLARDRFDGTVKTADDVRRHAKLDVLAVFPEARVTAE
jgi:polysaccharide biosynthesis transport protein